MSEEERKKKIETMKVLIKAECLRISELLDTKEELARYSYGPGARADLKTKMRELRKDTMRLDHLMYGYEYIEE